MKQQKKKYYPVELQEAGHNASKLEQNQFT